MLGKPDFIFPKQKIALFVDGCFWHGCPLPKHSNMPKNNPEFWAKKLQANKDRDKFVNRQLRKAGRGEGGKGCLLVGTSPRGVMSFWGGDGLSPSPLGEGWGEVLN